MKYSLVDELKQPVTGPWLVRVPGWTMERYLAEAPETQFCEFESGDLIMNSPARGRHQDEVFFLATLLRVHCAREGAGKMLGGPAVLRVSEAVGREPDLFIIPPERVPGMGDLPIVAVPSLIIEVVSPSTRHLDLKVKAGEYRELGVAEYWAVDSEREELTTHWPVKVVKSGILESTALPGFKIKVDWLWQDPLPPDTDCLNL